MKDLSSKFKDGCPKHSISGAETVTTIRYFYFRRRGSEVVRVGRGGGDFKRSRDTNVSDVT